MLFGYQGAKFLHADNEDSDQTARMRRLIRVLWAHSEKVRFPTLRLIVFFMNTAGSKGNGIIIYKADILR